MIGFFPEAYPDELAYSLFARYYVRSGYTTVRDLMGELYVNKWYRADKLFLNKLRPEAIEVLSRRIPIDKFVEKHTMFPYYARFMKAERRKSALESLVSIPSS